MGVDEPDEESVDQISLSAPDDASPDTVDQRSVRVAVEQPAATPSRPIVKVTLVVAMLVLMLVVNEGSSAGRERSLRTSDDTEYVEPEPTPVDTAAKPSIVQPTVPATSSTTPSESPAAGHASTTAAEPPPIVAPQPEAVATVPAPTEGDGASSDAEVSRVIPDPPAAPSGPAVVSPWADRTRMTAAGYVATDVGCAAGTSAGALDAFFRDRVGPVIGDDYQHVYPLGGDRYLWLFQDAFVDYAGTATNLSGAAFAHNIAIVQDGACFTLYHRGSISVPASFEQGNGENWKSKWFWPMGGETVNGRLYVYWAQMLRDGYDPKGGDGLGWHPVQTWLAVYDAGTLQRLSFQPSGGVNPIYGYAVASDGEYTYLFGNTFEQNLQREGGFHNGPHSGTVMWLARIPLGQFGAALEYRTADGWSGDPGAAVPISQRYWAENPMQPRYLNGQWVAATKIDGYWGESLAIDVANDPWGPWTTVDQRGISPRGGDPAMNTYHAHLMPWLSGGSLVVSISQNARNMLRDAWPQPSRYRPMFFGAALVAPPPSEDTTPTTIVEETTTTALESTTSSIDASTTSVLPTSTTPDTTTTTTEPTTTTSTTIPAPPAATTTTTTAPGPPPSSSTTTTTIALPPECPTTTTADPLESTTTTTTDPNAPPTSTC